MINDKKKSIAVVGAGAAGITAAYYLDKHHEVTLFEGNPYLGGHANTFEIKGGTDSGLGVDTGFIVFNDRNYPTLTSFFSELGISGQNTDMSLSIWIKEPELFYSSDFPLGLFAQTKNIWNRQFYGLISEIKRFYDVSLRRLREESLREMTLGQFLKEEKFSRDFIQLHLLPMAAAIWSAPPALMSGFPARSILKFYENHGLLSFNDKPQWKTVTGGSREYVRAFQRHFQGSVFLNARIETVKRSASEVTVCWDGKKQTFDEVVFAVHGDQVLTMLENATETEKQLFSQWTYASNPTILHTDLRFMPPKKTAWAAWNFIGQNSADTHQPVCVTYDMKRLQRLRSKNRYLVTLNAFERPREESILHEVNYTHPVFTSASLATQKQIRGLGGNNRTYYCGSYLGHGFHEDAVKSGYEAAAALIGAEL